MATIYSFGPFQLDDESEILFRGKEPTTVGHAPLHPANKAVLQAASVIGRAILSAASGCNHRCGG
jgi:hypothetical protein